jgi:hypothetical protein
MAVPTKADRDANLDKLKSEAKKYFDLETTRIDNETKFLRSVLQGRGARGAAAENLALAKELVQGEIDDFLTVKT